MKPEPASGDQLKAWMFYGLPKSYQMRSPVLRPVGEVGYVVGWIADQLSRLEWRVLIDGKESWTVDVKDARISSNGKSTDPDSINHPVRASERLLKLAAGWGVPSVKQLAVNLFVAGECHYVAGKDDSWTVVSVIHPDREELVGGSAYKIRALWPHPADPNEADPPLAHSLPILGQLDWLTRLSESQSSSRVGMRGVVGIADTMATQTGKDFWVELEEATQANMEDPSSMAPVVIRGPQELIEAAGDGMKGFSWVIPKFPYDDHIEERIKLALQRLGYALPIPLEILTGLQAQSKATAFQVEASAYDQHIQPPAELIASVAEQALELVLGKDVKIIPDPTNLLARRHSVQDVLEAFDRGAVSLSYLRSVLGIPEHAAATPADLEILYRLKGRSDAEATPDPGSAEARPPAPSQQGALLASLSEEARSIVSETGLDVAMLLSLQGATQQACDRARERVGAKARTYPEIRAELAEEIPNQQVAAALGVERLSGIGLDLPILVQQAVASLTDQHPGLLEPLTAHVLGTLEDEESLPVPDNVLTCLV